MTEQTKKINPRQLLNIGLLAAVAIMVLLVVYEPGKEAPPEQVRLTALKHDDVNHILLKRADKTDIELEKRNNVWFMLKPYTVAANDFRAQTISRIATAVSHAHYDIGTVDSKKFKLDNPVATITFNKQYHVALGNNEPLKRRRYMKSDQQLHIVDDTFYYQVMSPATTYASYSLLAPDSTITQLDLPKLKLKLQDGNWQVSPKPKDYSADSVTGLLNEWRHSQSLEVEVYEGKKLKPAITIHLANQDKPVSFALLRKKPDAYLIRPDLKLQYKLTEENLDKLLSLPPPPKPEENPAGDTDAPGESPS